MGQGLACSRSGGPESHRQERSPCYLQLSSCRFHPPYQPNHRVNMGSWAEGRRRRAPFPAVASERAHPPQLFESRTYVQPFTQPNYSPSPDLIPPMAPVMILGYPFRFALSGEVSRNPTKSRCTHSGGPIFDDHIFWPWMFNPHTTA